MNTIDALLTIVLHAILVLMPVVILFAMGREAQDEEKARKGREAEKRGEVLKG